MIVALVIGTGDYGEAPYRVRCLICSHDWGTFGDEAIAGTSATAHLEAMHAAESSRYHPTPEGIIGEASFDD